jgi:hypothetical protein
MAWEAASQKYVREYGGLLAEAVSGSPLVEAERDLLREILRCSPVVVHLQRGHGLDDVALVQAGAKSVIGIDYSEVAVRAAQRRADELGVACRYVAAAVPAGSSPRWQPPAWRSCTSASTRNHSGGRAVSPRRRGADGCRTPSRCSPAGRSEQRLPGPAAKPAAGVQDGARIIQPPTTRMRPIRNECSSSGAGWNFRGGLVLGGRSGHCLTRGAVLGGWCLGSRHYAGIL